LKALAWAVGITAAELGARRLLGNRARGWILAYSLLGIAALSAGPPARRGRPMRNALWLGVPLALAGYSVGCALMGHRWSGPPVEDEPSELVALSGVVAPVEELAWGGHVETRFGVLPTSVLFAAKHVVIDGRWRRALGLALFWAGLGMVRSRSRVLALGLHVAANAGGVILGHASGRDRF
jgi:hypothetical protein